MVKKKKGFSLYEVSWDLNALQLFYAMLKIIFLKIHDIQNIIIKTIMFGERQFKHKKLLKTLDKIIATIRIHARCIVCIALFLS